MYIQTVLLLFWRRDSRDRTQSSGQLITSHTTLQAIFHTLCCIAPGFVCPPSPLPSQAESQFPLFLGAEYYRKQCTCRSKVLSCHAFSINLVLSPQRKLIKRINNNYRNPSKIPCWSIPFSDAPVESVLWPTILSSFQAARHIATAFLATTWQGNHVGW